MLGLGLSLSSRAVLGGSVFTPARLFAASEPGVWYDPSDLSTMFQDTAGTTPVTTAGQSVALLLDKSRGLALGPELWADQTPTISNFNGTNGTYNDSTNTMGNIAEGSSLTWPRFSFNLGLQSGRKYLVDVRLSSSASLDSWLIYGLSAIFLTQSGGIFRGIIEGPSSGGSLTIQAALGTTTGWSATIDNISVRELLGNHATQATLAARPILRQTAGGLWYLEFDGTDDSLVTPTITPGTDKVQVFAGVRKLSDAATKILVEHTASIISNAGSFYISAPESASSGRFYSGSSRGTAPLNGNQRSDVTIVGAASDSAVIAFTAGIAADASTIRRNGTAFATATGDQGAGNYANAALYIGRRGGTTLTFNGHLYSLMVRFGPNLTDAQIAQAERWVNSKTKAY